MSNFYLVYSFFPLAGCLASLSPPTSSPCLLYLSSTFTPSLHLFLSGVFFFLLRAIWRWSVTEGWYCLQRDENSAPITTALMSTAVGSVELHCYKNTWAHTQHARGCTHIFNWCTHKHRGMYMWTDPDWKRGTVTGVLMCVSLLGGADLSYASFSKLPCRDMTRFHCL